MDFTHAQISFLSDCIADKNIKEKCIRTIKEERIYEGKYPTNKYNIKFSSDEKAQILDELTFLLTEKGLNFDDNVNDSEKLNKALKSNRINYAINKKGKNNQNLFLFYLLNNFTEQTQGYRLQVSQVYS